MAANYVLLEKITVGAAGAATVTFSGIPQTGYTDLVVKASTRGDSTGAAFTSIRLLPNGSSANGSTRWIRGNGTAASSDADTTGIYSGESDTASATASTFANIEWYIPNYAGSTYKSFSIDSAHENNVTTAYLHLVAGLWSDVSAITSITLDLSAGSFVQYSTFYLYGVAKLGTTPAIVPYATGGDTILTDGTYWYHTFVSSGTFTPQKSLTCDYLVVAGGGGGGNGIGSTYGSGGGGGGGLRSTVTATGGGGSLETALSLTSGTSYTVTVGAGGASNTSGANSVFSTITSTAGGKGGNANANNAAIGGSGGGAGGEGTSQNGSLGTANQGYAGGNNQGAGVDGAGGGGGAGAVGANGASGNSGNGGNGVSSSITGSSVTYAGGGGGGGGQSRTGTASGGSGGGGTGGGAGNPGSPAPTNGSSNTGGGGGGGGRSVNGGSGGSGIVIVRYAV